MNKTIWIINQYASTPSTGLGGRHFYFARELARRGYNVFLIASASSHILREQQVFRGPFKLEKVEGFTFVWVKMPQYAEAHSRQRALNWFLFPLRLLKLSGFISQPPDVVLCSSPSLVSFLGAQKIAKRFKARLIFEVRDIWPLTLVQIGGYSKWHPFIGFMQWIEDKAYRDSDKVISNLKNAVEHMVSRGMKRDKFAWIPNGFSMDEVSHKVQLNAAAAAQVPNNKFIVGYTGTLGVANALYTLLDAADSLRNYTDIAFVLVGSGKEKVNLQAYADEKKISNVSFIGSIPKIEIQSMLSWFNVCYIGLTEDPLFRFGVSPNKLFDYLYAGKPVIYAVDSGRYRPVEEAEAGIQVAPEDPEQLAEAILQLYRMSVEKRESMGLNGHKFVLDRHEYGLLTQKYIDAFFNGY